MEEGRSLSQDTTLEGQTSGGPRTQGAEEEECSAALPMCVPNDCT